MLLPRPNASRRQAVGYSENSCSGKLLRKQSHTYRLKGQRRGRLVCREENRLIVCLISVVLILSNILNPYLQYCLCCPDATCMLYFPPHILPVLGDVTGIIQVSSPESPIKYAEICLVCIVQVRVRQRRRKNGNSRSQIQYCVHRCIGVGGSSSNIHAFSSMFVHFPLVPAWECFRCWRK